MAATARTLQFTAGTTITVGTFNVHGNAGGIKMIIGSATSATHTLTSSNQQVCNDLSISYSIVDASPKWYAGSTSTDGNNNTNWLFTDNTTSINAVSASGLEYSAYSAKMGISGVPINQLKLSFYNSQLGMSYYSVDEAEIAWLKLKTTLTTTNSRDQLWRSYLVSRGVPFQTTLNDMKAHFFKVIGFA